MSRFVADRIAKSFVSQAQDDYDASSTDEEEDVNQTGPLDYVPSRLRQDAIPPPPRARDDVSEESEEYDSDSEDLHVPEPEEVADLEAELAELEENEGTGLIDSLRAQQEADLRVAHGTAALQTQYSSLLLLRLKFQPLLTGTNVLPPLFETEGNPYDEALRDPEVAALAGEIAGIFESIDSELLELQSELGQNYGWEPTGVENQMFDIIGHWGARMRMSGGARKGAVINQPVVDQIRSSLAHLDMQIQPSRNRDDGDHIFGVDEQPVVLDSYYNDYAWYKKLLAEYVGEKKPDAAVIVDRPKKHTLRGRQITYDVIPALQGFMVPGRASVVRDDIDVLYNSLMK
jgi:hypothetical protein